jgi:hypothetical protein
MASRNLTEQVKVGLAAGAVLAVFAGFILARLRERAANNEAAHKYLERTPIIQVGKFSLNLSQTFIAALVIFALFGTVNYNRYNSKLLVEGYDEYDLIHYYVTPKYFDELGYYRLLPAAILADSENGEPYCDGKVPYYLFQDNADYKPMPVSHALSREEEIKSHFTKERWREFVHDVVYLQRASGRLPCSHWRQLLQDHGFNGTPFWVLVARPIVSIVPVEWVKAATCIDLVWIIFMLGIIAWAFGPQTFVFAWIFITVCYSFRWPTVTWAMLRYDWVATMVIGVCLTKKKYYKLAGASFAYAMLMRYFPGLWLFGIAGKGIHSLFTRSDIPLKRFWLRVPTKYYKMLLGFALTCTIIVGASFARDGIGATQQSIENITNHVEAHNLSSMRQGLVIALTYRGETDLQLISPEKKEMVAQIEPWVHGFGWILTAVFGILFLSRAKDWEVVGLGMIPYFWLTTSSYYYYSMRLTAIVIHAADLSKTRNVVGLGLLFFIELFCNACEHINKGNRYFLISWMGILLTLYSIIMVSWFAYDWWTGRKPILESANEEDSDKEDKEDTPELPAEAPAAEQES